MTSSWGAVPEAHGGLPAPVVGGLGGAGDEVGGGGVVDAVAGVDGLEAERDREHCLAGARRADEEKIGLLGDEAQGGELVDEAAIERGLGAEVELLERLGGGKAGEPQPAGEAALLGGGDLDVEQVVRVLGVAGLVALG